MFNIYCLYQQLHTHTHTYTHTHTHTYIYIYKQLEDGAEAPKHVGAFVI